ncbi:DUF1801 domain-containing protein [Patescibacteria group bacterium]|nr:DUF1801 domain-containing protein [Patescibacteria group bacterium]
MRSVASVETYIAAHPILVQRLLKKMRVTIRTLAPSATEVISYGIPTFKLHGNLIHYAGYKGHIGLYPGSAALVAFKSSLTKYKTAKGSIQFPLDKPLPIGLIKRITRYCIRQNIAKHKAKQK